MYMSSKIAKLLLFGLIVPILLGSGIFFTYTHHLDKHNQKKIRVYQEHTLECQFITEEAFLHNPKLKQKCDTHTLM